MKLLRDRGVDIRELLRYIYDNMFTVSTLHVTIDSNDYELFNLDDLYKRAKRNRYDSCFKTLKLTDGMKTTGNSCSSTGKSIRIGSPPSTHILIYDKASEQHEKGKLIDYNHKVRFEMRLKHERTLDFIYKYLEEYEDNEVALFFGVLNYMIKFKNLRANRDTWKNWDKFVLPGTPIKLKINKRYEYDIETSFNNQMRIHEKSIRELNEITHHSYNYDYELMYLVRKIQFVYRFLNREQEEVVLRWNMIFAAKYETTPEVMSGIIQVYCLEHKTPETMEEIIYQLKPWIEENMNLLIPIVRSVLYEKESNNVNLVPTYA